MRGAARSRLSGPWVKDAHRGDVLQQPQNAASPAGPGRGRGYYLESIKDDQDLDPQFKSLLKHHTSWQRWACWPGMREKLEAVAPAFC
jgi:hypothetical protein